MDALELANSYAVTTTSEAPAQAGTFVCLWNVAELVTSAAQSGADGLLGNVDALGYLVLGSAVLNRGGGRS